MIDPNISELALGFSSLWNKLLEKHQRYHLDFTFPSVGNLDLFLQPLINKKEFVQKDMTHIIGASSYLGLIAHKCWSTFSNTEEVNLSLIKNDVVLSIKGGDFQGKNEISKINITQTLKDILQNPTNPFPFFAKLKRNLPTNPKLISMFALGLFFGLSPYIEGSLRNVEEADFLKNIKLCLYNLSLSCAEFYQRIFPTEKLGSNPELYHNFLILPPIGHEEKPYLSRNTHQLNLYLSKSNATKEEINQLLLNLSTFPNELISYIAFCLLTTYQNPTQANRLKLLAESYQETVYGLIENIYYANNLLSDNFELVEQANVLSRLGLTTLMLFSPKDYVSINQNNLLMLLVNDDLAGSLSYINSLSETNPYLELQQIYLHIKNDNYLEVETYFKKNIIFKDTSLENISHYFKALTLFNTGSLEIENILVELNKVGIPFEANDNLITEIIEFKVVLLCKLAKFQEAFDLIQRNLTTNYISRKLAFHYLEICSELELDDERRTYIEKLKRYVPYDYDLIQILLKMQ